MSSTGDADLNQLRIRRDEDQDEPGGSRWFRGLAVVLGIAVAAGLGWRSWHGRPIPVTTAVVAVSGGTSGVSVSGISANGYVVARTKASVSAMGAGRLQALGVSEGSTVRQGDIIARIDSADAEAQLRAAKAAAAQVEAQLQGARRLLGRQQALNAGQVVADQTLDDAATQAQVLEAQLASARAQVQVAEVAVENTRVRAPFAGTVLRKDAEVGEFVAPSAAGGGARTYIVTLADLTTLEVEVDVNEAYIARIGHDDEATIVLDAYPEAAFQGRVRQVVPTADRQKATVMVKVAILDRDPRILPEMGAKVTFAPDAAPSGAPAPRRISVPVAAVVRGAAGTQVWVVDQGAVRPRPVQVGSERNGAMEVRSGLTGGEVVVIGPPPSLHEGSRVKVASG